MLNKISSARDAIRLDFSKCQCRGSGGTEGEMVGLIRPPQFNGTKRMCVCVCVCVRVCVEVCEYSVRVCVSKAGSVSHM